MYQTNQLILNSNEELEKISLGIEEYVSFESTKRFYEKPYLKKQETMNFPLEIINSLGMGIVCKQCSSCHGCR